MTVIAAQALGCMCLMIVIDRYRPEVSGVLLYVPRESEWPVYVSALDESLREVFAAVGADAVGDADILDGGGHLPMTTGELAKIVADGRATVVADLDAIEAGLHSELDWVVASALLWLGADLETEHTLVSLAGYPGDCALREEVLAHA